MNIQDWFPLGWTGLNSLQSKGLSRVFPNTTVQKHQFPALMISFNLHYFLQNLLSKCSHRRCKWHSNWWILGTTDLQSVPEPFPGITTSCSEFCHPHPYWERNCWRWKHKRPHPKKRQRKTEKNSPQQQILRNLPEPSQTSHTNANKHWRLPHLSSFLSLPD